MGQVDCWFLHMFRVGTLIPSLSIHRQGGIQILVCDKTVANFDFHFLKGWFDFLYVTYADRALRFSLPDFDFLFLTISAETKRPNFVF